MTINNDENMAYIEGVVDEIIFRDDKNGRTFATVAITQKFSDGTPYRYPTRVRTRDAGLLGRLEQARDHLAQGVSVQIGCDVRESPRDEGGMWRDMISITSASIGEATPSTTTATATSAPTVTRVNDVGPTLDERIAWNSAINNSVNALGPTGVDDDNYMEDVAEMAPRFYRLIRQGPPSADAPAEPTDVPEQPQDAPDESSEDLVDPLGGEQPFPAVSEKEAEVFEV